jgi:hypothetical protein
MKYRTSAFYSDELHLSRWDLIKLFFGYTFQGSGLIVTGNPFYKSPRAIKEIEKEKHL